MSVTSPAELYKDPLMHETVQYWGYNTSLEEMLQTVEDMPEAPDLLTYLDGLEGKTKNHASYLLGELPALMVHKNYGEQVLVWIFANAHTSDIRKKFHKYLADSTDYDGAWLEKARLWSWQKNNTSKGKETLAQYAVIEAVTSGHIEAIDVEKHLKAASKPGVVLSDRRMEDYALIPLVTQDHKDFSLPEDYVAGWDEEQEPGVIYEIWLDAPSGFALTYKGRPQAVVGLGYRPGDELMIYQLQGVRGKRVDSDKKYTKDYVIGRIPSRGLAPLDWQRLMVSATEEFAANIGMCSVGIQRGEVNVWANKILRGETAPHLTKEAAFKAYDVPAQRLDFTIDETGNWHRPVLVPIGV